MARRKAAVKRSILPDPMFGSVTLAKFINVLMCRGKKACAEKIVYEALESSLKRIGAQKGAKSALELFEKVLGLLRPVVEVRSARVGGATYQVPVEVPQNRGVALAMRWLVSAAQARPEHGMAARLAGEIVDVCNERGGALKKRDEVYRMANANRAFAHYRW